MDAILNDILIFANVMILFVLFCVGVIVFLCMRFVTQGSKTFIFEELDEPSKDYLLAIGRNKGDDFSGVYIFIYNYNSWWAFYVPELFFWVVFHLSIGWIPLQSQKLKQCCKQLYFLWVGGS